MLKAAIKSLLGRKLRLLMSTFAIVLGVAFVGGSLVFSDTLGAASRRCSPRPSATWSSGRRTPQPDGAPRP